MKWIGVLLLIAPTQHDEHGKQRVRRQDVTHENKSSLSASLRLCAFALKSPLIFAPSFDMMDVPGLLVRYGTNHASPQ